MSVAICSIQVRHQNLTCNFLVFWLQFSRLCTKRAAVLRASIANAGNDHRLGANEAPPAIMSVFLGDQLSAILDAIETGGYEKDN